ncbi:major facilitator superfamily transporter, partial [Colletotrichum sojae]
TRQTRSRKKSFIVLVGIIAILNSTFDSSLPSGAIHFIAEEFHVTDPVQHALPISVYLVGYILGPLLFSSMSETYGRRIIMVPTFALFTATSFGPRLAPIVSGAVSTVIWRWTFWVGFIVLGLSCVPVFFLPETFKPTILRKRAVKLRKKSPGRRIYAPTELENSDVKEMVTVTLARPIRMFFGEPIVLLGSLYLAFASAIYFAVGSILAFFLLVAWDIYFARARKRNRPYTNIKEYERLPLACLGAVCYVVSNFWLGWTVSPDIHWIVPMLSSVPFGAGFVLIFMALLNYMMDAYREYAASAATVASCARSVFDALLPLPGAAMYGRLGVPWGMSFLGFASRSLMKRTGDIVKIDPNRLHFNHPSMYDQIYRKRWDKDPFMYALLVGDGATVTFIEK